MTDELNVNSRDPQPPPPARRRRRPWRVVYWVTLGLYAALLVGALVWGRLEFGGVRVPSAGMAPAIPAGTTLVFQRGAGGVAPGDIVIARTPNGLLARRLIGLPGDRVTCCDTAGRIDVDGRALAESYLAPGVAPSQATFAVTLGPGLMWLMADNRAGAYDSREWGALPVSDIVGRVVEQSGPGGWTQARAPETFIADGLAPAGQPGSPVFALLGLAGLAVLALVVQAIAGVILWAVRRRRRRRRPQPDYA